MGLVLNSRKAEVVAILLFVAFILLATTVYLWCKTNCRIPTRKHHDDLEAGWVPRPLAMYMTTGMLRPTTVAARPTRPSAVDTTMMGLLRHTAATRSRVQPPPRTTTATPL